MKKRLLWGIGATVLCLGLVACAQGDAKTEETAEETTEAYVPQLTFSVEGGVYAENFDLTITVPEGQTVYYTTDGSDPATSDTAQEYTQAIAITDRNGEANVVSAVDPDLFCTNYMSDGSASAQCTIDAPSEDAVDKCTTIRAVSKTADGEVTDSAAQTYFIGSMEEHIEGLAASCEAAGQSLAVISITMDYDDLFDYDTGIYVKGALFDAALPSFKQWEEELRKLDANYSAKGRDWERDAHIEFYEVASDSMTRELSQDCGIRIQGNYSRSDLQKSFRFYARSSYGDKDFSYAVWGDDCKDKNGETIDSFKTMVVRAGGNCAFTCKYNDTFWQTLVAEDGGYAVSTKASRPCVVYLNGEYWGLYVLEEDYSTDYFEKHYDVTTEDDNVIIYKGDAEKYDSGYYLDDGELPEGVTDEGYYLRDLESFLKQHSDLSSDEDYEELCTYVDEQSFLDYFAIEIWINNKWDWPGKNWSMWKSLATDETNTYADGRWRMLLYDVEFGGVSGGSDATTNTMKEDNYKDYGMLDQDTKNIPVRTFALLMTNVNFKKAFCDRLEELSDGAFEQTNALNVLTGFEDIYSPLFDQFFARYPGSGSTDNAINGGYASSKCIRAFLAKRADYIPKMIEWTKKTKTVIE